MSKNAEFVKFDKVDKSYDGKVLVVKDLNLDIAEGEFITMLGPSGSGKTTCLMMLAGFETPTNGQIYLDNKVISDIPPHKRGIGMVFQNYALFPHMTVYENLAFPLKVRKISKDDIDKKVDKALSMVSLSGFENRMPAQLSGGQQQRVGIARALSQKPKVMLADEPVASLDPITSRVVMNYLKKINTELGITTIVNLHFLDLAKEFGDRLIGLRDGKLVFDGNVDGVSDEDFENIYGRSIKSSDLIGND